MNKTWLACLLASLSLVSASLSHAQTSDSTEKAVLALENQWMKSQKENNPDILAPLLADKFVDTNSAGKVRNKTEALANARATKYSSVDYQDMKVTVYGDTAIATGSFKGQGTDESGKAFNTHSRWTDTWVKMTDGKWQCVATHGSDIKK